MDGDELVKRYARIIYNLSLRLTGDPSDASDVAQESLLKAFSGLSSFRGGDAGVWVYRITVNTWKNFLRTKSSRRMMRFFSADGESIESEPTDSPSPEPGPESLAEKAEEKERVEKALKQLSSEERAVLVLRELDGRSYEDIAAVLEIPLGTVKSRLARARTVLAEHLSEVKPDGA